MRPSNRPAAHDFPESPAEVAHKPAFGNPRERTVKITVDIPGLLVLAMVALLIVNARF